MSQVLLRFSIGFLAVVLAVAALSLYISARQLEEQERLSSTGDLEGAMQSVEMAGRLDPFSAEPLEMEAYLLQLQGRNQEAEQVLQRAAERAPHDYSVPEQLGSLRLMVLNQPQEAAESYRRAVELNPRESAFRDSLATAYLSFGELEKAKSQYEEIHRIVGLSAEQSYDLGRIYTRTGEPGEGSRTLRETESRASEELRRMSGPGYQQQVEFIWSVELALADALAVDRRYDEAREVLVNSGADQAVTILSLINSDPESYRRTVMESDVY